MDRDWQDGAGMPPLTSPHWPPEEMSTKVFHNRNGDFSHWMQQPWGFQVSCRKPGFRDRVPREDGVCGVAVVGPPGLLNYYWAVKSLLSWIMTALMVWIWPSGDMKNPINGSARYSHSWRGKSTHLNPGMLCVVSCVLCVVFCVLFGPQDLETKLHLTPAPFSTFPHDLPNLESDFCCQYHQ